MHTHVNRANDAASARPAVPADVPRRTGAGRYLSASTEATIGLGRALGSVLAPGDVIVLTGDLGAGKTQLTKGVAASLGIDADVTSPTFTIEMVYEGAALTLYHFDLYRLERAEQLEDTGLFDVLGGDGPCVIEWGEQFADELGDDRLEVTITRETAETADGAEPARIIALAGTGPRGRALVEAVDAAIALGSS